jgi:hypothetical protein
VDRIHVRAEGDHGARLGASEDGNDAMATDTGADVQAQRAQAIGNQPGRALFLTGDFGVPVDVSTNRDQLGAGGFQAAIDPLDRRLSPTWRCAAAK